MSLGVLYNTALSYIVANDRGCGRILPLYSVFMYCLFICIIGAKHPDSVLFHGNIVSFRF